MITHRLKVSQTLHLFGFSSSVDEMFPLRSRTWVSVFVLGLTAGIPSIPAALPEGIDLMAETISDLLGGVCGMLLAGK